MRPQFDTFYIMVVSIDAFSILSLRGHIELTPFSSLNNGEKWRGRARENMKTLTVGIKCIKRALNKCLSGFSLQLLNQFTTVEQPFNFLHETENLNVEAIYNGFLYMQRRHKDSSCKAISIFRNI